MTLSDDLSLRAAAQERRLSVPRPRLDASAREASPVWIPIALAAIVALGFATWSLATGELGWRDVVGTLVLLAAAAIAEAFPVPIEGVGVGGTSVATIFLVAATGRSTVCVSSTVSRTSSSRSSPTSCARR